MQSRLFNTLFFLLICSSTVNADNIVGSSISENSMREDILETPTLLEDKTDSTASISPSHKIYAFPKLAALMPAQNVNDNAGENKAAETKLKESVEPINPVIEEKLEAAVYTAPLASPGPMENPPIVLVTEPAAAIVEPPVLELIEEKLEAAVDTTPLASPGPMENPPIVLVTEPAAAIVAPPVLQPKPVKKIAKAIRKKKPKVESALSNAEKDQQLGGMVRQFFAKFGMNLLEDEGVPSFSPSNIRTGWYVGGLVGATINQTRLMITEGGIGYKQYSFKKRFENTLPTFGINIGKQLVHGRLLTDMSVFLLGTFTNNKVSIYNPKEAGGMLYVNSLKEKYRAGVSVALGTPIAENISIFGKVGVTYSNFNFHYYSPKNSGNFGKKIVGVAPGILLKYHPTPKFALSLDVNYMMGVNHMKSKNISSVSTFNYQANIRPQALTILLGLNRTF